MEGIYHTVPIPDVNNNKKSASKDQKSKEHNNYTHMHAHMKGLFKS